MPMEHLDARHAYRWAALCALSFAVLLRLCVGTHPYSGMGTPPMYGDYEAQRHWMEVTTGLPASEWYKNGPQNDLSYWGLDYPPLSGYQSWLCGKFLALFEPAAVALATSHGYETPSSKLLMRLTVVISDLLCYLPACVLCAAALYRPRGQRLECLLAMALNPALIIMDHGHFQYNGISLGFAALSVACIARGYRLAGSALFCASLSHKQMSLYLAPAFFAHLLGQCLHQRGWGRKLATLGAVGVTVVASFAVMWAPFLTSMESIGAVLRRIFPTHRGLFEDYVANVWCVSSLVIKWKKLFLPQVLFKLCTAATLGAFLPSVVAEAMRPSQTGFLVCMANSAFAFFMFSFQVHEKSILLPLLPITMLAAAAPRPAALGPTLMQAAMVSMYPLLEKDGLQTAYVGLLLVHLGLTCLLWRPEPRAPGGLRTPWSQSPALSLAISGIIHAVRVAVAPPDRYPFLWDALMVTWAFANFAEAFLHLNLAQIKRKNN